MTKQIGKAIKIFTTIIALLTLISGVSIYADSKAPKGAKEMLQIVKVEPAQNKVYRTNDDGTVKLRITFNKDINPKVIKNMYKENFFYIDRFGEASVDKDFMASRYDRKTRTLEYNIRYCRDWAHTVNFRQGDFVGADGSKLKPFTWNFTVKWTDRTQRLIDYDYFVRTYEAAEPELIKGYNYQQNFLIKKYRSFVDGDMTDVEFYKLLNKLIVSLGINDTFGYFPNTTHTNLYINLPIRIFGDEAVVFMDAGSLKKNDKISGIGGMSINDVLTRYGKLEPNHNQYAVKIFLPNKIICKYYLEELHLVDKDGTVHVAITRDGMKLEERLAFTNLNLYIQRIYSSAYHKQQLEYEMNSWTIDKEHNLGVFKIDYCFLNDHFDDKMHAFFSEVKRNGISNIALDMREYKGGAFDSVNPIFKYLNADTYMDYGYEKRYSVCTEGISYDKAQYDDVFTTPAIKSVDRSGVDANLIYKGKVFVMTSNFTCYNGVTLAAMLKINYSGVIVGEPTCNGPSNGSPLLGLHLPISGIEIDFPYSRMIVPGYENNTALIPDVLVETKADDYINGDDVQMKAIWDIIKQEN